MSTKKINGTTGSEVRLMLKKILSYPKQKLYLSAVIAGILLIIIGCGCGYALNTAGSASDTDEATIEEAEAVDTISYDALAVVPDSTAATTEVVDSGIDADQAASATDSTAAVSVADPTSTAATDSATSSNSAAVSSGSSTSSSSDDSSSSSSSSASKTWVAEQGHYETVTVTAAYDEKTVDYYEYICSDGYTCSTDAELDAHIEAAGRGAKISYSSQPVYATVHHDAVIEQVWVVDVAGHWE
jgi:hypothetical protein